MGLRTFTYNLPAGEVFRIVGRMGVMSLSFLMSSDTGDNGTYLGNAQLVDSTGTILDSEPVELGPGQGQDYISSTSAQPLDGYTLTCVKGTLKIIIGL